LMAHRLGPARDLVNHPPGASRPRTA